MGAAPIVVVGSINIDLVVRVERFPTAGETLLGSGFETHPGGKGANQAAAVARLGYPVFMIGRIGSDAFGEQLRDHLGHAGVDTSAVAKSEAATGVAMIAVAPNGENTIVVAAGANALLTPLDLDRHIELIRTASLVLTQLEIPLSTVDHLAEICARERVPLILDPAPAKGLADETLRKMAWITPNDTEAQLLAGTAGSSASESQLQELAEYLMSMGSRNVLLKLGERGAYLATESGMRASVAAFPVKAVDTTAAGDAFNGAFAVALARGSQPMEAAHFAAAAAAISVTRHGALASMATQAEVQAFLMDRCTGEAEGL